MFLFLLEYAQIQSTSEEVSNVGRLRDVADDTRAHLQRQLRTREADCNRMAVQIRVRFSPIFCNCVLSFH